MPSFDVIIEVDKVELRNAIDQSNKEISNRFDFKGSDARIELSDDETLSIYADDEFKMNQVYDLMIGKMAKRDIDIRSLTKQKLEKISGDKVKQSVAVLSGIDKELAKKIVRAVKDHKLKAQGSIQGDVVRFSGSKRDVLQEVISLLKTEIIEVPLQYKNFRD
ncbi:MAG: YajQ family cyclic di-GMP-binding protein [Betaproteobacteria bacterium]|nr:YajQ family cyclic di-GMP-binding protein [Betaproteobacteria bacterium]